MVPMQMKFVEGKLRTITQSIGIQHVTNLDS